MRKTVIIILILVPVYIVFMRAFNKAEVLRPRARHTMDSLLEAYTTKMAGGIFTNRSTDERRIFDFTNHFVVGGTNYQCLFAADSWDYQGASNLLAITTDKRFLYIDHHGAVPLSGMPPGY
jgi:hypothetical protein